MLSCFHEAFPNINTALTERISLHQEQQLISGELDVGIVHPPLYTKDCKPIVLPPRHIDPIFMTVLFQRVIAQWLLLMLCKKLRLCQRRLVRFPRVLVPVACAQPLLYSYYQNYGSALSPLYCFYTMRQQQKVLTAVPVGKMRLKIYDNLVSAMNSKPFHVYAEWPIKTTLKKDNED